MQLKILDMCTHRIKTEVGGVWRSFSHYEWHH